MADGETAGWFDCTQGFLRLFPDMRVELALLNCFKKGANFRGDPAHLHLDAAVGQVTHPAGHVESLSQVPDRPAEADALNAPFVNDVQ